MASDIELLALELDTLWLRDERGRLLTDREPNGRPAPHMVIAVASGGRIIKIGSHVPDALADELGAAALREPLSDPAQPPAALSQCARLLEDAVRAIEASSGPSYLIPDDTAYTSAAPIVRFGDADVEHLRAVHPPGANWRPDEWNSLLDGNLGPWAIATSGGHVISICHSARLTARGAEAGTWTDPGHRGRGHAAAVTAAWASLLRDRTLFYSTSSDNASSQRVAARLKLRPIGWTWRLSSPRD